MSLLSRWKTPAVALVLLAPLIGEVLNGATRLSYIAVFVLQIAVWGCGALIIREGALRWRGGWTSILLLGLALATAVELLILQTSLAPIPWLGLASIPVYDRVWGVNWYWLWFMLGYEAVWIVLVPILVTELIFPAQRHEPWVGRRGLTAAAVAFGIGSLALWGLWTQMAVTEAFKQPKYWPPATALAVGMLVTIALILAARLVGTARAATVPATGGTPSPWTVFAGAMALGFPWWVLITLVFVPQAALPLWIPLAGGLAWAAAAFTLVRHWSRADGWGERHRWALAFGALLVCMAAGFLGSNTWPATDVVAKAILNVIAVERMIALARRIWTEPKGHGRLARTAV